MISEVKLKFTFYTLFLWLSFHVKSEWRNTKITKISFSSIKIFQMIENLRAASATNGGIGEAGATNGTVFVLDTSSPSGASDSQVNTISSTSCKLLWRKFFQTYSVSKIQQNLVLDLQRRLAQIMAFAMPNTKSTNPLFLVKFDGTRSWYNIHHFVMKLQFSRKI